MDREKLQQISEMLRNLRPDEKFDMGLWWRGDCGCAIGWARKKGIIVLDNITMGKVADLFGISFNDARDLFGTFNPNDPKIIADNIDKFLLESLPLAKDFLRLKDNERVG